ncbi:LOW QUALITY PROTEIN: hypothetical protein CFOL_v3_33096, partial [Cephalotus follicularis]
MDQGLNSHCLKGLCPGDPPQPLTRINPPGGLPSYKSDTGAGFSKKPRYYV